MTGWQTLPYLPRPNGTGNNTGCQHSLLWDLKVLQCAFLGSGFHCEGLSFRPCKTAYHPDCIAVGTPFTTCHTYGLGLTFPLVADWANFVCEACTVCAVIHRELTSPEDWSACGSSIWPTTGPSVLTRRFIKIVSKLSGTLSMHSTFVFSDLLLCYILPPDQRYQSCGVRSCTVYASARR
jgi:hypothetical protein